MDVITNMPHYCEDCSFCRSEGAIMVGTDDTGGGPEEAYSCSKTWNMFYYKYHKVQCPDFDGWEDDY